MDASIHGFDNIRIVHIRASKFAVEYAVEYALHFSGHLRSYVDILASCSSTSTDPCLLRFTFTHLQPALVSPALVTGTTAASHQLKVSPLSLSRELQEMMWQLAFSQNNMSRHHNDSTHVEPSFMDKTSYVEARGFCEKGDRSYRMLRFTQRSRQAYLT